MVVGLKGGASAAGIRPIDLVLAGGGVKGIGLVGAVVALLEAGYRPNQVAGTSAGSIVGSILAAAAKTNGIGPHEIRRSRRSALRPSATSASTTTNCRRSAATGWWSPPPT